jgi:threonine synthase
MTLRCEGCGAIAAHGRTDGLRFTCPAARPGDDVDHLLVPIPSEAPFPADVTEQDPFRAFSSRLSSRALAEAHGLDFDALVARLDAAVAAVDGQGFRVTPLREAPALAAALDLPGPLWVKDETGHVAGSHKARHLMGIALHLEVADALGWLQHPVELAIASCGNAALAAAVVARAAGRPLSVFIPTDADPVVVERLHHLGARVEICAREPGQPGDPTWHRFQAAVAAGAVPFCCQGPANGLTLEGGQTLGWELGLQARALGVPLDHVLVQVGGGALASSLVRALEELVAHGVLPRLPRIHTVQTTGAAPLVRATGRVAALGEDLEVSLRYAARHRAAFMWPWEEPPHSVAHGILDDETYDWARVAAGTLRSGGRALVVTEDQLVRARTLAVERGGLPSSHTGAAGLAGALALVEEGEIAPGEGVVALVTGVAR